MNRKLVHATICYILVVASVAMTASAADLVITLWRKF